MILAENRPESVANFADCGIVLDGLHKERHQRLVGSARGLLYALQDGGNLRLITAGAQSGQRGDLLILHGLVYVQGFFGENILALVAVDADNGLCAALDSAQGGVFNEGRAHGTSIVTPSLYRIDATVDDRRNGERLWQAWATASLQQSDGATLTRSMVPVMVGSLGKTVRRQTFQLP